MPAHPSHHPGPELRSAARRFLVGSILASSALLLGACGGTATRPVEAGAPAAPLADERSSTLPTLPPVEQVAPERFDDAGCVRTGPDESDCASTAAAIDEQARGDDTGDWRRLAGFEGRSWSERPGVAPVVLADTVSNATSGPWTARGLVRNETAGTVGRLIVTAELVGGDGSVLAAVQAPSPVTSVRPGEPVPFELTSTVPVDQVAGVRWSASADAAVPADEAWRSLAIATYWTRDPASGRQVDFHLHTDQPGAPLPYLLFGGVQTLDGAPAAASTVFAAWLGADGRVALVAHADSVDGDVLIVVDDQASAAVAAQSAPMLWAVAR